MPQLNTSQLSQYTDLVEREFAYSNSSPLNRVMRDSGLVKTVSMPQGTGEHRRFAETIDTNLYSKHRAEGDNSQKAKVQYGYEKDASVETFTDELSITKRMRIADKTDQTAVAIRAFAGSSARKIELDLAHRLTFAFDSSYVDADGRTVDITTGDGLSLINSAHTLTGSAITYSNQIPANPAFSKGALEAAEKQAIENTYNNLGEKTSMDFDTIFCTDDPNTQNQIMELLNATANVNSDNAGTFNVYRSKYKMVSIPSLATTASGGVDSTKSKYWGIASSMYSSLKYAELEAPYLKTPSAGGNGEDFSSENFNYLNGATYAIATCAGRWIHMSKGNGQA